MFLPHLPRSNVSIVRIALRTSQLTFIIVEYAELAIIDLEEAKTPEGRARLAPRVRDAMRDIGFIALKNHGWTKEQVRGSRI